MKQLNSDQYSSKQCIICVNPTMSLDMVFTKIKRRGYQILTILTGLSIDSNKVNAAYISSNSDYIFHGRQNAEDDLQDINKLIKQASLEIRAVINGIDASIYYCDYLVKNLLNINLDLDYSKIRLNKFEVNNVLVKNNINAIQSLELFSPNITPEIETWISQIGWPLVVKPSENTASMAGFKIIHSRIELDEYLVKTFGSKNAYYEDFIVNKIILQKYIPTNEYTEYILDFMSYEGKHYLQGIGSYYMESIPVSNQLIYRDVCPLTINEVPNIQFVIDYMIDVLNALKIEYGFTHNEVFWDHKNSCYLVESNSRMAGSGFIETYQNCYGYSPLKNFLNIIDNIPIQNIPEHKKSHSMLVFLYNFYNDNYNQINVDGIKSLQLINTFYKNKKTTKLFDNYTRANDVAAVVILNNPDLEQLNLDMAELMSREQNGTLFVKKDE